MYKYYKKPKQIRWYDEYVDFLAFVLIMGSIYAGVLIALLVIRQINTPKATLPVQNEVIQPVPKESNYDPCGLKDVVCDDEKPDLVGQASWYDYTFTDKSTRICFRDREDCYTEYHAVTAARDFPRGTRLLVTNIKTGASVEVVVTDYGPEEAKHPDRVVDLSSYAFSKIAPLSAGHTEVEVKQI